MNLIECWANGVNSLEFTIQSITKDFHLMKDGVACGNIQATFKVSKNKQNMNFSSFQEYAKEKDKLRNDYKMAIN